MELTPFTPEQVARRAARKRPEIFLTTAEVADLLGTRKQNVLSMVRRGHLVPAAKLVTGRQGRPAWLYRSGQVARLAR